MDDVAHLLLGFAIARFLRIAGAPIDKLAVGAALVGSVLPDIIWLAGIAPYDAAHRIPYYAAIALPFVALKKTRWAAICFVLALAAHVIIDAYIHVGEWMPLYPMSSWEVVGKINYWQEPLVMVGYWIAVLALVGLTYVIKPSGGAQNNKHA